MDKLNVRIVKEHENAKMPVRAHEGDAGADLFYCPKEDVDLIIDPHSSALASTGLKIEVPDGCMLEIKNKSGIAAKRHLVVGACVVDRGYTGVVFVNLHNIGYKTQVIHPGEKIAQAIFVKIENFLEFQEASEIYDTETSRGSGALGSTGDT